MLIEPFDRAEKALHDLVAAAVAADAGALEEMRSLAKRSRALVALSTRFQTAAAGFVAKHEHHGDGGEQLLAGAAGLSRRDPERRVSGTERQAAPAGQRDRPGVGQRRTARGMTIAPLL